jgi:hypothetical protein
MDPDPYKIEKRDPDPIKRVWIRKKKNTGSLYIELTSSLPPNIKSF